VSVPLRDPRSRPPAYRARKSGRLIDSVCTIFFAPVTPAAKHPVDLRNPYCFFVTFAMLKAEEGFFVVGFCCRDLSPFHALIIPIDCQIPLVKHHSAGMDEEQWDRDRDTIQRWTKAEVADLENEAERAKAKLRNVDRAQK
jgi:hypothetical protein